MRIVPFHPDLAPAFAALNREWIERYFVLEAPDLAVLEDPQRAIIDMGGEIFFAVEGETPVGTAAAIKTGPGRFELAKMAVASSHQGLGLGKTLGLAVITWARKQGAEVVFLLTNSKLDTALRLYQRLGFVQRPLPDRTEYARADVYMELVLHTSSAVT